MPRGSWICRVSPTEKPIGRAWTHGPAVAPAARGAGFEHAVNVGFADTARPAIATLASKRCEREPAARRIDDHAFDLDAGHPLRRVDGEADRVFDRVEVDDGAALDPARALMPDAEDAAAMRAPAQRRARHRSD